MLFNLSSSATQSRLGKGERYIEVALKFDSPQPIVKSRGLLPARVIAAVQDCIPALLPDSDSLRFEIGSSILAKSIGFDLRTITITTRLIVQSALMEGATDSKSISFTSEDEAAIAALVTALRTDLPNEVRKRLHNRLKQIGQARSQVLSASASIDLLHES
jgi:hypothetical protein